MNYKSFLKKLICMTLSLSATVCSSSCSSGRKNGTGDFPDFKAETSEDGAVFELFSKNSDMVFQVKNNIPMIVSLKTSSGTEKISSPCGFGLPEEYDMPGDFGFYEWKYTGYKQYIGDRGGAGYVLSFKDTALKASYSLYIVAYPDEKAPFEFFGTIKNGLKNRVTVEPGAYFNVNVGGSKTPVAWTFDKEGGMAEGWRIYSGQFYGGTGISQRELSEDTLVSAYTTVCQDWNQSGDIPMMYIDYGTDGIYFALEWTHGKLTAEGGTDGDASLSVSLAEGSFKTNIPSKESIDLPPVYLGAYDGDVDDGSNQFKRWFLKCKAPECILADENEPLTQQDMQIGYDVSEYGIQSIKWDYGWWDNAPICQSRQEGLLRLESKSYIGVLEGAGCNTISEFTKKANSTGVKLALYILLKDTGLDEAGVPTSAGKNGHPEWFSNRVVTVGRSADLGNEDCVKFYKKYLLDFFSETGVTTWRSDFEPICSYSDKENRHRANGNDVQYWCTVGFEELVDSLYKNLDDFRYESCSSGGSMKDFFTMTKAVVINCDDSADYMSLHMSFYDSSYCVHPAQLQLPINALTYTKGSQYYTGTADYLYGLRCAMTGGVMLSNWGGTTQEDKSYWPYWIAEVYNKKMKPLIREADIYHILPRPDGVHWDGLEYFNPDADGEIQGLIMLWKPTDTEGSTKNIILRGLDSSASYSLVFEDRPEQNKTMTGEELMMSGLDVTISESSGSEMIWITKV